jgi:hypothetical protein
VKNNSVLFLVLLATCISCGVAKKTSFQPRQKYAPSQLQTDFSLLQKILEANHPGLYWYTTADSVNSYFSSIAASLTDSLTETEFRNKISWVVSKIHCGHTTVRPSKKYVAYLTKHRLPQFPLSLKIWEDSAVVVSNLSRKDSVLKRGTTITGINEFSTKQIIDSICTFIGTDGYADLFKYQLISFNFPAYYRNAFGTDSSYEVRYVDSVGREKKAVLKNVGMRPDSLVNKQAMLPEGIPQKQLREMKLLNSRNIQIDTTMNTAFLAVNTFSGGKLRRFFKSSFKKIKEEKIANVVVDLRLNSGGDVLACTKLSQYLVSKPFRVADTVAAFTRKFPYKEYIKPWFIYWLSMHISGKRYSDNRIHFRYFENHNFKPVTKDHFDGNIYLLTGGYTFSAATLLAQKLKGQENVTIVGEETGGGAYGNSAMFLTDIILPNTGIRITLPLYRMVLNAKNDKNGRGVFPDVEVKPSSTAIKMGIDAKLETVKELIKVHNNSLRSASAIRSN